MIEKNWWKSGKQEKVKRRIRKVQQARRKYRGLAKVLRGGVN